MIKGEGTVPGDDTVWSSQSLIYAMIFVADLSLYK